MINLDVSAIIKLDVWLELHDSIEAAAQTNPISAKQQSEQDLLRRKLQLTSLDPKVNDMTMELRRDLCLLIRNDDSWENLWLLSCDGARPDCVIADEAAERLGRPQDVPPERWGCNASDAAVIRGESGVECTCDAGRRRQKFEHIPTRTEVYVTFDSSENIDEEHRLCLRQNNWKIHEPGVPGWMPPRFSGHCTLQLEPHPKSPLSEKLQAKAIGLLPPLVDRMSEGKQRSWLLVGPAGSSKTTYISAVLTDFHTLLWTHEHENTPETFRQLSYIERLQTVPPMPPKRTLEDRICMWRIKVPDWLVEVHDYDTRDFGGPPCSVPSVTVESIRTRCKASEIPPVLWLEEVDKFSPTRARLNYLYRLIDAVYELRGTIVAAANLSLSELQEHLGDAIYRRIAGTNDDDGAYTIMDFHELLKIDKGARSSKSRAK